MDPLYLTGVESSFFSGVLQSICIPQKGVKFWPVGSTDALN